MPNARVMFMQIDQNIARGMAKRAFRVSSEIWAAASKPVEKVRRFCDEVQSWRAALTNETVRDQYDTQVEGDELIRPTLKW